MITGKLKRSLKEKCPYCAMILQLRTFDADALEDGIPITIPTEIICCSNKNCDYEREVEQKRRRRKQKEEEIIL